MVARIWKQRKQLVASFTNPFVHANLLAGRRVDKTVPGCVHDIVRRPCSFGNESHAPHGGLLQFRMQPEGTFAFRNPSTINRLKR